MIMLLTDNAICFCHIYRGTEAAEDRETTAETDGGQKIHVSLQKRRSSVLKEISSQVLDKWQLRQHVTTHSDIYNASSTDLSSPSSIATVIRGDQKQFPWASETSNEQKKQPTYS
ncbi:hypothetical protein Tco_0483496 [Tanacetum coccineum]